MDWKERYALYYRDTEINEKEVVEFVQNVLDNISSIFKINNIKAEIEFDLERYIISMPNGFEVIQINFYGDRSGVTFERYLTYMDDYNEGKKTVELTADGGRYTVFYEMNQNSFEYLHISYDLIDSIFEYLLT